MAVRRISVDPGRMGGRPTLRGTRTTDGMVLSRLATGRTVDADSRYLDRADAVAALRHGATMVRGRQP